MDNDNYINSKRRFPTNSSTEIQQLHPLKLIHYDTIPQNYRSGNQILTICSLSMVE